MTTRILLSLAALGLALQPAAARPLDAGWPVVASASDGDCALEVTGNGRVYLISATGLGEGRQGRYRLANGDMTPIDWSIRAGSDGRFARYYMPFRFHREGGTVDVRVDAPGCSLTASFPWRRAGVRVID